MDRPGSVIATTELDWDAARHGRHPFNPASEMKIFGLGDMSGMSRVMTNLIRIPPGKESYIPHAHSVEEEMVFILSGAGEVVLDGVAWPLSPGDFVGFPTDGVVHSVRNTGQGDLTYLSVGERATVEVAEMPTIGKTAIFRPGRISMMGQGDVEDLTPKDWRERSRLPQTR